MSLLGRAFAWAGAIALVLTPLFFPVDRDVPLVPLLLGPFAKVGAQVQWLRFQAASLRGEEARALELAESALSLDPRVNEGWQTLAAHLVFDLASREREPSLERRRAWFRAGLAVLERGVEQAAHPDELLLFRGLVLIEKSRGDPELAPMGARALLSGASAALERAAALGNAAAIELAPQVRADADSAE